jgi:hypothetical protein
MDLDERTTAGQRATEVAAEWLGEFEPVSLEELDARVALQRRVDQKYLLPWERFAEVGRPLRESHEALEIDGNRVFSYSSVYFDTPDLLCFRDHVEGRVPRFKVRSRLYHESGVCSFEVKVKLDEDETVKDNLAYDSADHGRITPEARDFVEEIIQKTAEREAPDDLEPALTTRFRRGTLGAGDGTDRVTIDLELRLERPNEGSVCLFPDLVVVETKSEAGQGRCDHLLQEAGISSISLSKYRLGIGTLAAPDPEPPLGPDRERYLERC